MSAPALDPRSFRREGALALVAYVGVALAAFGPNLPTLGRAVIGRPGSDAMDHLWGQWWVQRGLLSEGWVPFELDLANFPDGGRFYCLSIADAIVGLPLRILTGTLYTFNVLLVVHVVAACLAAWVLCRDLARDAPAAWVGGLVFGLAPYALSNGIVSGVTETVYTWPLPLVVLCWIRTLRGDGWGWPVAGGLLLLVQAIGGWAYPVHAGLFAGVLTAFHLAGRPPWRPVLRRVATFAGVVTVLGLPLFLAVHHVLSGPGAERDRGITFLPHEGAREVVGQGSPALSLLDPVLPGDSGRHVVLKSIDHLESTGYVGLVVLLLAVLGARADRSARRFVGIAALFHVLALGPRVYFTPSMAWPGWPDPLYDLFYWFFPLFHETRHVTGRFALGTSLGLAVAATFGLSWLRARGGRPITGVVGAAVLLLAELALLSPVAWPFPQERAGFTPATKAIAARAGGGGVIDLPYTYAGATWFLGDIRYQQILHRRPIPYRFWGMPRELASPTLLGNAWYRGAVDALLGKPGESHPCRGVEDLAGVGFELVVVRWDRVEEARKSVLAAVVTPCLEPVWKDETTTIFRVPGYASEAWR